GLRGGCGEDEVDEPGAFVGVGADEDGGVVELAGLKEFVGVVREEVAIGHGTELAEAEAYDGVLDLAGAEGVGGWEVGGIELCEEFLAGSLGGVEGWSLVGRDGAAAFGNGLVEQVVGGGDYGEEADGGVFGG